MDERITKLDELVEQSKDALIADLAELVKIPSKKLEPDGDAPFGKPCKQALEAALKQGERMGFKTVNLDNYIGWIEAGEGDEMLAILAHTDVVPEGDGWTKEPYGAQVEDGYMYGRGTQDDKGPAVSALYALKAVLDAEYKLNKRVRIILGSDEESGSSDIEHYIKHAETPTLCFSPDAEYPLVNGEKGILTLKLRAKLNKGGLPCVIKATGGTRPNVVAPTATAVIAGYNKDEIEKVAASVASETGAVFAVEQTSGGGRSRVTPECKVDVTGMGAHAAMPWKGNNANTALVALLSKLELCSTQRNAIDELARVIPHGDVFAKAFNAAQKDEISGDLTLNFGQFEMDKDGFACVLNIRYPITSNHESIIADMKKALSVCALELTVNMNPHYVSPDSQLVKKLLEAYEEVTNLKGRCMTIGGGTYARSFPGGVSFGCMFEDGEDLMHQANERVPLGELTLNAKILAHAIVKLAAE